MATGYVYKAINTKTNQAVAIKAELATIEGHQPEHAANLPYEAAIYNALRGIPGIPTVHYHSIEHGVHYMVMDLLGPTLEELRLFCRQQLSLRAVCMLAEQLVRSTACSHSGSLLADRSPISLLDHAARNDT